MRKREPGIILLLLVLLTGMGYCPSEAQTVVLQELRQMLSIDVPSTDTVMTYAALPQDLCLRVEHDSTSLQLTHLGVALFDEPVRQQLHPVAWRAFERILLHLLLLPTDKERERWMTDSHIRLISNHRGNETVIFAHGPLLAAMLAHRQTMEVKETLTHVELLLDAGAYGRFRLSLPKDRELLCGTDKKEADEQEGRRISRYDGLVVPPAVPLLTEVARVPDSEVWHTYGQALYLDSLRTDRYFQRVVTSDADTTLLPIESPRYVCESVCNLLLGQILPDSTMVEVVHMQYGGRMERWLQPARQLIGALVAPQGIEAFAACQYSPGDVRCQGLLLAYDSMTESAHMLKLEVPCSWIGSGQPVILQAILYTNVPQRGATSYFEPLR